MNCKHSNAALMRPYAETAAGMDRRRHPSDEGRASERYCGEAAHALVNFTPLRPAIGMSKKKSFQSCACSATKRQKPPIASPL